MGPLKGHFSTFFTVESFKLVHKRCFWLILDYYKKHRNQNFWKAIFFAIFFGRPQLWKYLSHKNHFLYIQNIKRVWRYLTDQNRNDKIHFWKLFRSFGFTWCQKSPKFFLPIFGHQQLTFGHFRFLADFLLAWIQKWKIAIEWPKMTLDRWKFIHNIIGHIKTQSKACF